MKGVTPLLEFSDLAISIMAGICLAACAGLRIFLPAFICGCLHRMDLGIATVPASSTMDWIGSDFGLLALGFASTIEVLAYFFPWLDNLLDTAAAPVSVAAGAVMMTIPLSDLDPTVRWVVSVTAGGGVAGAVQLGSSAVRAASSLLTAGILNPVFSGLEAVASIGLAVLAVFAPLLGFLFLACAVGVMLRVMVRAQSMESAATEHVKGT